jgi:hypothetical protein
MSNGKLKMISTETDNLISSLRAEVGAIIDSFLLMRKFKAGAAALQTDSFSADMQNAELNSLYVLKEKLEDEIVARLSELAECKVGCINFFFASEKLGALRSEVREFGKRIEKSRFSRKRNHEISHKVLPEKWEDHRAPIHIPYGTILRVVVHAIRLMKCIDRRHLGPCAPYLWREMRKRRYSAIPAPPGIEYMLLPHLKLSGEHRIRIVREEERDGTQVWSEMSTTINGLPAKVLASRKWGMVMMADGQYLPLEVYPLVDLTAIQVGLPYQPVYEDRTANAKYRCKQANPANIVLEPVEREHRFPDGSRTELPDITVNLNDEIRKNLGVNKEGEIVDFALSVRVLAGFEVPKPNGVPEVNPAP